jgi:hypothetical protein
MQKIWKTIARLTDRIGDFLRRWMILPIPWFVVLPMLIAIGYWAGFRSLAFSDHGSWRIAALPKVFFDQTMYLEVLAKDLIHGFHIIPLMARPFLVLAHLLWPMVSLSELYVLGVIASAIACLWLFAWVIEHIGSVERGDARVFSLAAFLVVHAVLILRPAGPSWYVPFFLVSLALAWIGEQAWEKKRANQALLAWIAAIVLSSVYPWYFASIVALLGLLFMLRQIRPFHVLPGLAVGLVIALIAIVMRAPIVGAVTSSYAVLLAYYGGVQFSHLTTLSNTILLMLAWFVLWLPPAVRARRQDDRVASMPVFFLAAWSGQLILWFQSLLSGLSIVPDHFIYSVWLLSALSWALWSPEEVSSHGRRIIRWVMGGGALLYVLSIFVRIGFGTFLWTSYPSLIIHVGSWIFLALTALPFKRSRPMLVACLFGVFSTLFGLAGVWRAAMTYDGQDHELDGVRTWIMESSPSKDLRWCSDTLGSDFLFSTTGQDMYPVFSEKHDPVSIAQLQNRLIEESAFFHASSAKELFIWDDMILHDLDFPCRAFQPAIGLMDHVPMSTDLRQFVTGCNQAWADGERARVIAEMEHRWNEAVPQSSALCDRFVVRRRLWDSWRVPLSYSLLYKDDSAAVYGIK